MTFKYRITIVESERGWGRKYEHEDFDTREEAKKRINEINDFNVKEYAETRRVPDWYMQADGDITIVEV